jgi:hypothetical protein
MAPTLDTHLIGVISDTHGLLRPAAVEALRGTDVIIHAGDIGKREILESLCAIASVFAVRGNMDTGGWVDELPETEVVELGNVSLYVLHDLDKLDLDPAGAGFDAVISGHTHRPNVAERKGVLFLNPGTAGPFRSPVSIALLRLRGKALDAHIVELDR